MVWQGFLLWVDIGLGILAVMLTAGTFLLTLQRANNNGSAAGIWTMIKMLAIWALPLGLLYVLTGSPRWMAVFGIPLH